MLKWNTSTKCAYTCIPALYITHVPPDHWHCACQLPTHWIARVTISARECVSLATFLHSHRYFPFLASANKRNSFFSPDCQYITDKSPKTLIIDYSLFDSCLVISDGAMIAVIFFPAKISTPAREVGTWAKQTALRWVQCVWKCWLESSCRRSSQEREVTIRLFPMFFNWVNIGLCLLPKVKEHTHKPDKEICHEQNTVPLKCSTVFYIKDYQKPERL